MLMIMIFCCTLLTHPPTHPPTHPLTHSLRDSAIPSKLGGGRFLGRIEGFDVSHTAGQDAVASQVVFQHGRPSKKHYRKYAIKSPAVALGHSDDYEAIREVIRRRFAGYADNHNHDDADVNVEKNGGGSDFSTEGTTKATAKKTTTKKKKKKKKSNAQPLPDLFDGGKGQLSAAMEALAECGLTTEAADATGGGSSGGGGGSSGSGSSGSSGGAAGRSRNGVWHDGRHGGGGAGEARGGGVVPPGEGAALEALNNPQAPAMLPCGRSVTRPTASPSPITTAAAPPPP